MGSAQSGQAGPDERVRLMAERALVHAQRGELAAARALYVDILAADPTNLEAINFVAIAALQAGDLQQSVRLLRQGVTAHPGDPGLHKNLGLAYRAGGDAEAALAAFAEAIRLKPDFVVALLNQGALLLELGREGEALRAYIQGFNAAEKTGQFLNLSSIPPGIRVLAEKGFTALREARLAAFHAALAPVALEHGAAALTRVWQCLHAYLGMQPEVELPTLQRPTFMRFPGLDNRAWFEREEFPWMQDLERHTTEIREELLTVLAADVGFRPFIQVPTAHPGAAYWRQLNDSPSWNAFFFYRDGERNADNHARCPATSAALDAAPLVRVAEHSPETFFSVLKPGAHIPPHTGVVNIRLVVHLPLIVPPDCGIRVGKETRGWEEGKCVVFDDTFEHEAWNKSSQTRVMLICDIWNPYLTAAERDGMRVAIEALGRFNRSYS
ncbi:MAG TPA: aspartyl/asparaginyl beta-hydroxylase domain-containing protein [Gammaproteobacteria bacterium]|nr:aspartyl/asparaginyl beta-hydroxylase domain-containing protein [Gammaproteobacteria bacterium]